MKNKKKMLKSFSKLKIIPKNYLNLMCFSSNLKYYPLKRLDFSKSDYECIYRNNDLEKFARLLGRSIGVGYCPSLMIFGYYLAFLDLSSLYNILLVGASFFMSFSFANFRLNAMGIYVKELYISKNGQSFKCFYTKHPRRTEGKDLSMIKFDYVHIKEKKIIKFNKLNDEKEVEKEDLCFLNVEKSEDEEVEIKLYFQENSLSDYNEYIIALGQGKQIVMK